MINSRLETHIKLLPPHCCPWSRSPWQQAGGVLRCSIHPLMLVCRVFNFNTSSATHCLCRSVFCLPVALCPSPSVCRSFHCCPSVSAQLHFLSSCFLSNIISFHLFLSFALSTPLWEFGNLSGSFTIPTLILSFHVSHINNSMFFTSLDYTRESLAKHIHAQLSK